MDQPIIPLKSAIIGKMWVNQASGEIVPARYVLLKDMNFSKNQSYLIGNLSFRTDRNLNASENPDGESPVELKAGDKLFFYVNNKRAGFRDPDYSVSVLLPENIAEAIKKNNKEGMQVWRSAHPIEV